MSKRAKRTKIIYSSVINTVSSYECPHCHVFVQGAGIRPNVTRFNCTECNNEIIVDKSDA